VLNGGAKRTQAVHCTTQRHWDASGAGSALGCPSAFHSLPVKWGCSVVQNGASSACLSRLSIRARSQLSPAVALWSGHSLSMCGAHLQTVCSLKACIHGSRKCGHCSMTWTTHACRTCTGRPA